jgi:YVTN family beta-propeller protein/VCBS repeat-containing protein
LVHAEPGALVYAVPGAGQHPLQRKPPAGWVPGGPGDVSGGPATHRAEEHPALHYAGYIGRIGVLAAALGVGAAMAGNQGIAWAEPSDSDSSSSSSSGTESTAPRQRSPRRGPSSQSPDPTTTRPSRRPGQTTADTPDLDLSDLDLSDLDLPSPPRRTGSRQDIPLAPLPSTTVDSPQPAMREPNEAPPASAPRTGDGSPVTSPAPPPTAPIGVPATQPRAPRPPQRIPLPSTAQTPAQAMPAAPAPPAPSQSAPTAELPQRPTAPARRAARSDSTVDRIVGAVLEPLTTPNSPALRTVESTASWGLLAWVRRTFFNQDPTLAYNPTQSTQVDDTVTGTLNPLDPDGDTLTYTATAPVNGGNVTIAPDGTFTYTPTGAIAAAGGTDTFSVTASDAGNGFHLHGVSGLINLITFGLIGDAGHSATTTVTVDVNAAPVPAAPPYTLGAVDHSTGAVPGEFHVTDADADTLHYTVTGGPADGAVSLATDGTFTYTPTATARHEASAEDAEPADLADSFIVTVDDNHGRTVDIPVTVSIDSSNVPPTITGVAVSDPESDGTVNVTVTVTDPDTDPVTYLVVHDPAYGTVAPTPGGFAYTPTEQARHDAAGTPGIDTDTFQISASDLHHGIDTATATVVISPANIAPSGLTQSVNIPDPATGLVTGTVTGTDADGDALTYSGSATTAKGSVIVDPDGTFAYTPTGTARHTAAADAATEADKADSFTVTADDAHGGTADLTVNVAVAGANVAPVGNVTVSTPDQSGVVTGVLNATDGDNDTLTYAVTTTPGKGAVTVNPDGSFSYAPSATARHAASADDAGSEDKQDSFTVTVDDAHGAAVPMAVTVAVSPANTAPSGTVTPNSPDPDSGQVTGSTTFTDPDGDTLLFTGSATTTKGSVTVNPDGTFTYTPTDDARHNAAADTATIDDTQDSFTITVNDGHGAVQDVPVTVTIGSANAAPAIDVVVPQPDPTTGQVNGALNAADPDGDTLSFTATTPGKGNVTTAPDGTFTYTPTDDARHTASADTATLEDRQDTFTITVNDAHGAAVDVSVLVSVSPTNQAPTGTAIPGTPDPDSGIVTGSVSATDPEGDPLAYSGTTTTAKGSVTVDPDGTFTYTPTDTARHNAAADTATPEDKQDNFTVTVDDAHGGQTPVTVTVAISSANTAPTGTATVGDPDPITGIISGAMSFSDTDDDTLTYSGSTSAAKGSITVNPDGTFTYTPTPEARHNAATDGAGADLTQDIFAISVGDGHGATSTLTVVVPISPVNAAPTAHPAFGDPGSTGLVGGSLVASDTDGDTLTYAVTSPPAGGTVTVYPDGTFSYDPTDAARLRAGFTQEAETDSFTVTITDGHGGVTIVPVSGITVGPAQLGVSTVTVGSAPGPMVISGDDAYVANSGGNTVSVIDTTTDPDSVTVTIPSVSNPSGAAVNGDRLYVSNWSSSAVTVVDTTTNTVVQAIGSVYRPMGMDVSGGRLYVANYGNPPGSGTTVTVIDLGSNTVTETINVGSRPYGVTANGSTVYVSNSGSNTVSVIDTATNTVTQTVAVGARPLGMAINGDRLYVTNFYSNSVTVIDTATNTVIGAPIPVGSQPNGIAFSPDGSLGYVSSYNDDTVTVFDTTTNTVIDSVRVGAAPATALASPDGNILVSNSGGNTVSVISLLPGQNTAPTPATPAYTVDNLYPVTGIVDGAVRATDVNADVLNYSVPATSTKGGAVTVNQAGVFTYTPTTTLRHNASTDNAPVEDKLDGFTVTVTDAHGANVTVPVTVPISPANATPTASPTFGTPDAVTGVVTGAVAGSDSDADPLSYALNQAPTKGTVTVNADGTFTYDPTDAARLQAGQTPGPVTDSFTVTITDGHGGTTVAPVTGVTVSAAQLGITDAIPVGSDQRGIVLTDDGAYAYVSNIGSQSVSVIDTSTNTVVETITDGFYYPVGMALSPDGSTLYTSNWGDGGSRSPLTVIDTATNTVVGSISAGHNSHIVVVSPDGSRVYVSNYGSYGGSSVLVIDPATGGRIADIPMGGNALGIGLTADGGRAYVASTGNTVSVIDTATNTVTGSIPLSGPGGLITMSPDRSLAYVSGSNGVSVIDTSTNSVIGTFSTGSSTSGTAFSADGTVLYVANDIAGTVSAFNVATNTVIDSATVGNYPGAVAVHPNGDAYVVNTGGSAVKVVSLVTGYNVAPTAQNPAYTITATDPGTGKVTGTVRVTDANADLMTYVTSPTTGKGSTVTVAPDGSFSYTPTSTTRHAAALEGAPASDTEENFTVKVVDAHGASTAVPVTVTISPTNAVPVTSGSTVGTPGASGEVTGSLNVTDPDADTLSYTIAAAPTLGNVTVDPATGAYTYTPSSSSRVKAYSTPAVETDSFTVTVSDGHGGSRDITVTAVPVSAADAVTTGAVSTGPSPYGVALSPNGTQAYVVNYGNNTVAVVNTATGAVTNTIGVGANPYGVALTPNGKYAYVTNRNGGTVSVIDTATKSVVKTVAVGNGPQGVAVSPDGNLIYVTNRGSGSVSVIDTNPVHGTYNTVIATVAVAGDPFEVAFSPDGTDAYVARAGAGSVAVIDTATSSVVNNIAVGSTPYDVAFSPDGTHAYVPNLNSNTMSVIDTASQSTTATISIPGQPTGVAVSPDGTLAYVTTMSGNAVSLIDTSTNTVIDTVPFNTGSQLYGVATSPDGTHAYVTSYSGGRLSTITLEAAPNTLATVGAPDPATGDVTVTLAASDPAGQTISLSNSTPAQGAVTAIDNGDGTWTYTYNPTDAARLRAGTTPGADSDTFTISVMDPFGVKSVVPINVPLAAGDLAVGATVPVGLSPYGAAVTPDGDRIYVTNQNANTVSVLDAATNTVIATVAVGGAPIGVVVSPDGQHAYVSNAGGNTVSVIDTSSNTVSATINVYEGPYDLAVTPDGSHVYVSKMNGGSVQVIDTATNTISATITGLYTPWGVAVNPAGTRAYVVNNGSSSLTVIDTATNMKIGNIAVGMSPTGVTVSPDGSRVYVANQSGTVSVISTSSNSVIASIPVGSAQDVAVTPDGSLVYAVNRNGSVSVIDTATLTVIDTLYSVNGPRGIAISPDGTHIYVPNNGASNVSVLSMTTVS